MVEGPDCRCRPAGLRFFDWGGMDVGVGWLRVRTADAWPDCGFGGGGGRRQAGRSGGAGGWRKARGRGAAPRGAEPKTLNQCECPPFILSRPPPHRGEKRVEHDARGGAAGEGQLRGGGRAGGGSGDLLGETPVWLQAGPRAAPPPLHPSALCHPCHPPVSRVTRLLSTTTGPLSTPPALPPFGLQHPPPKSPQRHNGPLSLLFTPQNPPHPPKKNPKDPPKTPKPASPG